MTIPRARTSRVSYFLCQPLLYEVLSYGAAAFVGATAARRYFEDGKLFWGWSVMVGTGVILAAGIAKSVVGFLGRVRSDSTHDLEGCLQTLHSILENADENAHSPGLRITLHVPIMKGEKLEQVCNYVTDDESRRIGAGRTFSANCGLIGDALRTGNLISTSRTSDNAEEYVDELVSTWHYTKRDARKLDMTVMSMIAVPLQTPERSVEAVVYVDSQKKDFFTTARQDLVLHACTGIALFSARRYN